jgi:hypothetical protein
MATLETNARNAACDAITALVDNSGPGTLVFETSGDVEVATCTFAATAFGPAAAGVCTADTIVDDSDATGGDIAQVSVYDGVPAKIMECTIAVASSQDFQISSLTIGPGDTVSVSAMTVTVPAS